MITYKLITKPEAFSFNLKGVKLHELLIELNIFGKSRIIDTSILSTQGIIQRPGKIKHPVVKNRILNLEEMLKLNLISKIKYIESILEEVWKDYGSSKSSIEVLDIVEEKLKFITREVFNIHESLDDLLIRDFAYSSKNSDEKLDLAMLLRIFYYYQIKNAICLDFSNYRHHIQDMKIFGINEWVDKGKCYELFDEILDDIIDNYYCSFDF